MVVAKAATSSKFCTQVLSPLLYSKTSTFFFSDKYNKMCNFPLKINRNLPSLCHFYQEWFIKGHCLSVKE